MGVEKRGVCGELHWENTLNFPTQNASGISNNGAYNSRHTCILSAENDAHPRITRFHILNKEGEKWNHPGVTRVKVKSV
jgi:hypothetical protein